MTIKNDSSSFKVQPTWNDVYKNNDVFKLPWVDQVIKPELKSIIDNLHLRTGKALDIGCGLGQVSRYLAMVGFEVTAIDISEEAIKWSIKLNNTGVFIDYKVANSIEFISRFNYNLIIDFLHIHDIEIKDIRTYLLNIDKLLAPEGTLLIATFSQDDKSNNENNNRASHFVKQNVYYYNINDFLDNLGQCYHLSNIVNFKAGSSNLNYDAFIYQFNKTK